MGKIKILKLFLLFYNVYNCFEDWGELGGLVDGFYGILFPSFDDFGVFKYFS